MNMMSFDICSVPKNFDEFVVDPCIQSFDVIGLCETRLDKGIEQLYRNKKFDQY